MTAAGNRRPSSSIVSARAPLHGNPVLPQEPNDDKVPVARQWLLGMRRFTRLALDRSDYTIREIETRLYPTLRHADGCPAVRNDELHCLADAYETRHEAGCPAAGGSRVVDDEVKAANCDCPRVLARPGCPDRELRMTLRCVLETLIDLTEQAPLRKFSADEPYLFPTRDGYTAMVAEIEYLRERLAELAPGEPARLGAPEIVRAHGEAVDDGASAS
jgi:hypothetical protein